MVMESEIDNNEKIWLIFLKKHWKISILFIIGILLAVTGAILVFLWFVAEAQATNFIPATLDLWAMNHFITFVLHLLFWEAIYVGIPIIIAVLAIYFLWWKPLPDEERKEYKRRHLFGSESSNSDKSGGISFLIFIAFAIKIYLDGNWNTPIASWSFNYLVYSCIWSLIWVAIIFGIPIGLGLIWWIHYKIKNTS